MKVSVKTNLERVQGDLGTSCAAVIREAKEKNGGWFNLEVETLDEGTLRQNNAWHSLLSELWDKGETSYKSYEDMRDKIKIYAAGVKEYIYLDDAGNQHTTRILDDIPYGSYYVQVPKSWRDIGKRGRMRAIDYAIQIAVESGVDTKKFYEILEGMEK